MIDAMQGQEQRRAYPMARAIIGMVLTLAGFVVDPAIGTAIGVVCGIWVVLGIGSVMHAAATERPAEHNVRVQGSVAHVVVDAHEASSAPRQQLAAVAMIECPECSSLISPTRTTCRCGWAVATQARSPRAIAPALQPSDEVSNRPKVSPACPQCRAPTAWNGEFERFFCSRCDAYL
jgi:hypothetical protein